MINLQLRRLISYILIALITWMPVIGYSEVPIPGANFSSDGSSVSTSANGRGGLDMVVTQQDENLATYNWDSFNIGRKDGVQYIQPSTSSTALNYIHQQNASMIDGSLTANGNIILINQNGIMFGDGAVVDVGGLVASTLDIDEELLRENGFVNSMAEGKPLFTAYYVVDKSEYPDDPSKWVVSVESDEIEISQGATLNSNGGRIVLVAPEIINNGSITTPGGQTILVGADQDFDFADLSDLQIEKIQLLMGGKHPADFDEDDYQELADKLTQNSGVYFASSTDPDLRGLFVEVGNGGNVHNFGEVIAERGNITALGLSINQDGVMRATTSVNLNGSIRLLARDSVVSQEQTATSKDKYFWGVVAADDIQEENSDESTLGLAFSRGRFEYMTPTNTGEVKFFAGSETKVVADEATADETALRSERQFKSIIDVMAADITVEGTTPEEDGALVKATGGIVQMVATRDPADLTEDENFVNDGASLVVGSGAKIDVSGATNAVLAMAQNVLAVDVTSNELADSPLQKDGVLNGETVFIDLRGVDDDGIDILNINDVRGKVKETLAERLSDGGEVRLVSTGHVDFQENAEVDISGGEVNYQSGFINETRLVSASGQVVDISDANKLDSYVAVLGENERYDTVWGKVETFDSFVAGAAGTFVQGYKDGGDAGQFSVVTDSFGSSSASGQLGTVVSDVYVGPYQQGNAPEGGEFLLNMALSNSGISELLLLGEDEFEEKLNAQTDVNSAVRLTSNFFTNSADNITIKTSGDVAIGNLTLDGGGELDVTSESFVQVTGVLRNPAGDVSLTTKRASDDFSTDSRNILIDEGAVVDTSALWINRNPILEQSNPYLQGADLIAGGDITISALGSTIVASGSKLIADGGALLDENGKVTAGKGGDIRIVASNFAEDPDAQLVLEGDLQSLSLEQGGALSLVSRGFQIGGDPAAADGRNYLASTFFEEGGFSRYVLSAGSKGVEFVASDTPHYVRFETDNYILPTYAQAIETLGLPLDQIESGAKLADIASLADFQYDVEKQRVDLTINAGSGNQSQIKSGINIGENVIIDMLPGSVFSASSDSNIYHGGKIINQGGEVSLSLSRTSQAFSEAQAIRFANGSVIDVSATFEELPPDGSLWPGFVAYESGAINIKANRGYILGAEGSQLIADGDTETIFNQKVFAATGDLNLAWEQQALDAGTINLTAAEGILFDGQISAKAATQDSRGGTLDITMVANNRFNGDSTSAGFGSFAEHPMSIVIADTPDEARTAGLMESTTVATDLSNKGIASGTAYVDVDMLKRSGVDTLGLKAINTYGQASGSNLTPTKAANIQFATSDVLTVDHALILDAPEIFVAGQTANIESNYLSIGTSTMNVNNIFSSAPGVVGDGTFSATANHIDLSGSSVFADAEHVELNSSGDIRLIGRSNTRVNPDGSTSEVDVNTPTGRLITYGDLTLSSRQIAPTSLTEFDIQLKGAGKTFETRQVDAPHMLLSAMGTINVFADNIVHGGTLIAPFGQINLGRKDINGELVANDTIVTLPGSLLSVSGDGLYIPLGEILAGDESWSYTKDTTGENLLDSLVDKSITLKGDVMNLAENSTIDVSGGGDIFAYKFTKGIGGSVDVLDSTESFVILPMDGANGLGEWGAYDGVIYEFSPYAAGDTIYIGSGAGVPAGEYAILPARYALIPGSYLVTPSGASGDVAQGMIRTREDGAAIVAGKFGRAGIDQQDSQWTPLVIESGEVAFERSQYDIFLASEFLEFTKNAGRVSLPQDAGGISLEIGSDLTLNSNLLATAGDGGLGGYLDIAAERLLVTSSLIDDEDGTVQLLDNQLSELEVESLLLGGTRQRTLEGISLDVSSDSVAVAAGAELAIPELLVSAKDQVIVNDGVSIQAGAGNIGQGGVARIDGDGAFLQVSAGGYYNVVRENSLGDQGDLIVGDALLSASNSITLESTHEQRVSGQIKAKESFNLTAQKLTVVTNSGSGHDLDGVTVSEELLANVGAKHQILKSRSELTFLGDVNLDNERVTLDTPELVAGVDGSNLVISGSEQLVLSNSSGSLVEAATVGNSSLTLQSNQILMQGGTDQLAQVTLSGFDSVTLKRTSDQVAVVKAEGQLAVDAGDAELAIQSDGIIGAEDSELLLRTRGDITYASLNSLADVENVHSSGINPHILFDGATVNIDGNLLANSGDVEFHALGSLNLLDNAFIDVSGTSTSFGTFDPITRVSSGGTVTLISETGDVSVAQQAVIDLRAGGDKASSGELAVDAKQGTASLAGEFLLSAGSGSFSAELGNLVDSAEFVSNLLASGTAFSDEFTLHVKAGDIEIDANTQVVSRDITLDAAQGSVSIRGQLDASGESGGNIMLASQNLIELDNANINASALDSLGSGGTVVLQNKSESEGARIIVSEGSIIDVSSGDTVASDGVVKFVTEYSGAQSLDAIEMDGQIVGSKSINWLVNNTINDSQLTQADVNTAFASFSDLATVEAAMRSMFNEVSDKVAIIPQVEVYSESDIEIAETIVLKDLRFGSDNTPGELLIRSENAINVDNSVMAGTDEMFFSYDFSFNGTYSQGQIVPLEDTSWGLTLVSGADSQSADRYKTVSNSEADIVLDEDVSLITGTGNLSLHSGGDILLNPEASIMTIGRTDYVEELTFPAHDGTGGTYVNYVPASGTLDNAAVGNMFAYNELTFGNRRVFYGENGGDIVVSAKGSLSGNEEFGTTWGIDELDTHWRFRYNDDYKFSFGNQETKKVTTWGIYYENFEGVGVLAGGDIDVDVGGDVANNYFAAPTVGVQVGANPDSASGIEGVDQVAIKGGGNINLNVGGNIESTSYLVSNGELNLQAGGSIGAVDDDSIALVVSYGNADMSLEAVGDITINATLPEFLTSVSASQNLTSISRARNQFNAWVDTDANSSLDANSWSGDVNLSLNSDLIGDHFSGSSLIAQDWKLAALLPSETLLSAFSGDINLTSNSYLLPTDSNALLLLANDNINVIADGSRIETALNNMDLNDIPTMANPVQDATDFTQERVFDLLSGSGDSLITIQGGERPSQTQSGDVVVIAENGNINGSDWLFAPGKESYIEAGTDIVAPELRLQNNNETDITRVIAGNDILYSITRNERGVLQVADGKGIYLSGNGTLFVQAGGDIKLGASQGIRTNGNLFNSALPDDGADLIVLAGVRENPDIDTYLAYSILDGVEFNQADFAAAGLTELDTSMPNDLGVFEGLIDPEKLNSTSLRAFINLSESDRNKFTSYLFQERNLGVAEDVYVYQNFFKNLQDAGKEQSDLTSQNIEVRDDILQGNDRAYSLIDTLFPGSSEQVGVWDGDIDLVFSTLQTQSGGDAYFLTPGGGVNVGLPASIEELENNPNKQPKDLGIFAKGAVSSVYGFSDGNIDVNQSRIFTLDGGDILLWSSNGNVDAGKGARSAQSVPPPITVFDENGNPQTVFPPAISGSGIGTFQTPGREPGDVYLFAPRGFIDAGEAGIQSGGNLTIVGDVINAENIDVGGVSVGVPVNAGVSSSVTGLGDVASSATDSVTDSAVGDETQQEAQTAFLTVEIIGLGE